ncbi:bifunctional 3,4-dihydroxy-2-butanone-4-phosphate synthase/GTP cyclohydrolase II [Coxiella endosymbiont of Amblyomma americanum]|uniref:bifunctional 3,4-dihydroxy-2-butanone-4-phosphate synthase/GTP cyclohydrolase II n=1 Tax=Coxiella endosymbiont of Amblyomma americanum TaxID=325775 RepID=UPI000580A7DF|nr:bifunctional 3,4-dihydroxy-2-butanone-4-phosphate synthase/GTP cyclohydrolase II [Coxiella endosymbiont of Amblyomma americanum]AJC50323.1 3,4-dihydroxy-2-butanone 4-phosphate synthase [Coxiella endosymbiont of Amblyomma americanum]AUJ58670.1 bifunctional 3,4-dihydroxy-2-butanone-4-phosphate synthase/GTP cyclohydrolase II [Coxiella-like endosymbiont of Amblyomma americanum]
MKRAFDSIETALKILREGGMIILVDDESRENEGDLIVAAVHITPDHINFMAQHGRGLICLPMVSSDFERLGIPMMASRNKSRYQTPFGVSIEGAYGVTTGISAQDRARTICIAVDEKSGPDDIVMPGHVFPLKAMDGGVLARPGHTEGSVDLCRLANLKPAAVLCEILKEDGEMARLPDLQQFSARYQLPLVSIHDLITYRINCEVLIDEISASTLPLKNRGKYTIKVFRSKIDNLEHVALISQKKKIENLCLVRIHSECLTGDVFGSSRCDCGWQLAAAVDKISSQGGILLYLRQEGRGIGLGNKIKAYALQERGLDTVEANDHLGFQADLRDYGLAAQILRILGVQKICLLTNNPKKVIGLSRYGIEVSKRVALETMPTCDNIRYLKTKREKLGHLLNLTTEVINDVST